jgi:hypothetical protein
MPSASRARSDCRRVASSWDSCVDPLVHRARNQAEMQDSASCLRWPGITEQISGALRPISRRHHRSATGDCTEWRLKCRPLLIAWTRRATSCSPSRASPRANGNRSARRMRSSGTKSSSGGSRPRPCCLPRKLPRREAFRSNH